MPAAVREKYDIRVVPLHILMDEKCYEDGVNVTPADLIAFHQETGRVPTTAAVSIAEYTDHFAALTADGSAVVHLSFSAKLSSTYQNAVLAAAELKNVYVVDAKSLTTGISLLCIKAAEMVADGYDAQTIAHEMEYRREKVVTTFILDKLEFLHKGGRCSGVAALGANVLGIKPSIVMTDGVLSVGKKYRGKIAACQLQYVRDLLEKYDGQIDLDRVFLSYTEGMEEQQLKALQREVRKLAKFKEVIVCGVGCTITTHCGRNTFTLEFMLK